jgi:hypothetical protein
VPVPAAPGVSTKKPKVGSVVKVIFLLAWGFFSPSKKSAVTVAGAAAEIVALSSVTVIVGGITTATGVAELPPGPPQATNSVVAATVAIRNTLRSELLTGAKLVTVHPLYEVLCRTHSFVCVFYGKRNGTMALDAILLSFAIWS